MVSKQKILGPGRLLTVADVLALIRVSRATLHTWRRAGLFPAGVMLGPRRIGFPESAVNAWIASRPSSAVRPPAA
jgi:predicted DNA-binding transcriptional regulator AlpA